MNEVLLIHNKVKDLNDWKFSNFLIDLVGSKTEPNILLCSVIGFKPLHLFQRNESVIYIVRYIFIS